LLKCLSLSNLAWQHLRLFIFWMVILGRLSMGLAHILQTIPNRPYWPASCKAGMLSMSTYHKMWDILLTNIFRCTAPATDLDSHWHVHHSQAHTELLVETFELSVLWDEYGLIGDVVVSILPFMSFLELNVIFSHSPVFSHALTFMSFFHLTSYTSWSKVASRTISLHG